MSNPQNRPEASQNRNDQYSSASSAPQSDKNKQQPTQQDKNKQSASTGAQSGSGSYASGSQPKATKDDASCDSTCSSSDKKSGNY